MWYSALRKKKAVRSSFYVLVWVAYGTGRIYPREPARTLQLEAPSGKYRRRLKTLSPLYPGYLRPQSTKLQLRCFLLHCCLMYNCLNYCSVDLDTIYFTLA